MALNMRHSYFLLIGLVYLLGHSSAFYLPGVAPKSFCSPATENCQTEINILVNRLESIDSALPYDYKSFDFCDSKPNVVMPAENLGQILFGERIESSAYNVLTLDVLKFHILYCSCCFSSTSKMKI